MQIAEQNIDLSACVMTRFCPTLQLAELRKQSEEVNTAVETGEETRRKLQRELDSAVQRERQREEEKERVERQRERLREEIEDMTLALQRERQNCTALEKRQKKFDQVFVFVILLSHINILDMASADLCLFSASFLSVWQRRRR